MGNVNRRMGGRGNRTFCFMFLPALFFLFAFQPFYIHLVGLLPVDHEIILKQQFSSSLSIFRERVKEENKEKAKVIFTDKELNVINQFIRKNVPQTTRTTKELDSIPCDILGRSNLYSERCNNVGNVVLPFLVTGTGRSGTEFVHQVLHSYGLDVSHDRTGPGTQGAVSWPQTFNTVKCRNPVWNWRKDVSNKKTTGKDYRFREVFQLVRHPLKQILSRANNGEFFRSENVFTIRCNTRLMSNLTKYQTLATDGEFTMSHLEYSLIIAMRHWVLYNSFLERYTSFRFKVEDFGDIEKSVYITRMIYYKAGLMAQMPDTETILNVQVPKDVNHKHTHKPSAFSLGWEHLYHLDRDFAVMTQILALKYGYDIDTDELYPDLIDADDMVEMKCKFMKTEKWGCVLKRKLQS